MQLVSPKFDAAQRAARRLPKAQFSAAFAKQVNAATSFFTIGVSSIGGPDILKGTNSVLELWDKYQYLDYSNRVIDVSYDRSYSLDPNIPLIMAQADIILDNHDNMFTPGNTKSQLYPYILPQRPVRLYFGFDNEVVPIFVGVTDGMPVVDDTNKTVAFHCLDFLSSIINTPLENDVLLTNVTEDVAILAVLQACGLSALQCKLDAGSTILPFVYFGAGSVADHALKQLVQTGLGRLYMDELGLITYENRVNWLTNHSVPVFNFNRDNCIAAAAPNISDIVNVVEITSNARSVSGNQLLWTLTGGPVLVPANGNVVIWADFTDSHGVLPVTAVDTPLYISSSYTSYYQTNAKDDGTGPANNSSISTAVTLFSTSYKTTFTNSSSSPIYIMTLVLWGIPAPVTSPIFVRVENTASTALYDQQPNPPLQINNDYIQSETAANSIGGIITGDLRDLSAHKHIVAKGIPPLQVGDLVYYQDESTNLTYSVIRINGVLSTSKGFQQNLDLVARTIKSYFTIGVSSIGGTDQLAP